MGRDIVGLKYMAKAPNYISLRPIISHQQKPHNHPFSPCLFSPFIFWQGWARWLNIQNIKGAAWRYKGLYGARWLIFWPATVVLIRSSFRCTTHVPLRLSLYHSAQKEKGGNQRHDSFRQTMYRQLVCRCLVFGPGFLFTAGQFGHLFVILFSGQRSVGKGQERE